MLRTPLAIAPQGRDQPLLAKFFSSIVERFGDAVRIEGPMSPEKRRRSAIEQSHALKTPSIVLVESSVPLFVDPSVGRG